MTTKNDALKALLVMFNSFPVFGSAKEKEDTMDAYWAVLEELPYEDVARVCLMAARGEIGDGERLPKAAQLYQAARPESNKVGTKPSPDWRPHQDRFLSSSGTLYMTEGGKQFIYTAEELREWGYALPAPPTVLNRDLMLERGVEPIRRVGQSEIAEPSADPKVASLIRDTAKKAEG